MAELRTLDGQPCPFHAGATITARDKTAICVGGDYADLPKCNTVKLTEYAISLNGHKPEPPGPKPVAKLSAPKPRQHEPQRQAVDVFKRVPPHHLEAEQSVLGAILIDNEAIARVPWLRPAQFYREAHQQIFQSMLDLRASGRPVDAVTLSDALKTRNMLEATGGAAYIAEMAAFVPTAANIEYYAKIVREKSIARAIASRATQLASYAYDGVSLDALIGEMERTLKFDVGDVGLPTLINKQIEIISGAEFYKRHQEAPQRSWLVDGLLAKREISLWSGKVEAGKTTCMRTLVMALLRGEFFLERATYPSKVLYVMLDADGEDVTFDEFRRLGWEPERDDIDFLIDPVMAIRPNSFQQFHQKLLELKPNFVIVDPLGRFQKIDDITDYGTTYAMAQFSELAKQTNCHIALLHHIPRGRSDADDPATAGFGSIAIAGGCNARFVFVHKKGDIYTVQSSKGKGGGFRPFDGEQTLKRDSETGWVTLGGAYSFKDQARGIKQQVLEIIRNSDRELTSDAIARELHVQRSAAGLAAKMLADDGLVRLRMEGKRYIFFPLKEAGEE